VPRVVQILTYTGDGSASRTIGFSPLTGKRPLFAIIVPHNGAWYVRDPAHTGTTCTQFPATPVPSGGIVSGGIDQITVGAALNANNVIYEVFCFVGSDVAGNNGWSVMGEFIPVSPVGLAGEPPWDDNPPPAEPPPDGPSGPVIPGAGFPGTGVAMISACGASPSTTINQAFLRPASASVMNIKTDLTQEADTARQTHPRGRDAHAARCGAVARTRHATLQLVTGVCLPD
jgi:hypothetical protein